MSKQKNEYKNAEALGELKTMPEVQLEIAQEEAEKTAVIDNPEDFRMAIGNAQLDQLDHVIVSEKLFKYLLKNSKSKYLTYGEPGIKVYLEGTKEKLDRLEQMNADDYHNFITRERNEQRR